MIGDLDRDDNMEQRLWQSREDLNKAYQAFRMNKIKADSSKMHLETLIIKNYREGLLTVGEISERSHTSRGVIYRLLHKEGIITNTPEDDHGSNTQSINRRRDEDQPNRRMA